MNFELVSKFSPTGDQPKAITQLVDGLMDREEFQTLLGVTGSGKTFTIANVIKQVNRPTLVLSHNKTLAAQLYSEFKQFFPNNAVEYFVSYYDYYQPEAYIPSTGTYIEKDLSINKEIEKLRLNTTSSLLSGRKDIIVVSSVSCIYGIGNPEDFNAGMIEINSGDLISRNHLLQKLVTALYSRTEAEFERGNFRVKGDTVDIYPAYTDIAFRIHFFGNEIEEIESINPENGHVFENISQIRIYPASIFVASKDKIQSAISIIQDDLVAQIEHFQNLELKTEAKRIKERTEFDLEMIKELGYCSGIENYSRYFDGRSTGTRPFCLLDYFPDDFITVIDESHVSLPQVRAMFGGDRSRKETLVEHGFRLPAALDNRPLKFEEFELMCNQTIYVSATAGDYEFEKCNGVIVEQFIRPTGLLDPEISVRPSGNQIDDLLEEIRIRIEKRERVLVTTLTKRMAEEFTKYLGKFSIKCRYIHSDVPTLERVEIISGLKEGVFDVLIGVNLLREGLDLPEVSLVAIMDADKEGFLRSEKALIQTAGRAARNLNGLVIMYADRITNSMQRTINDNLKKRKRQQEYNKKHNITPTQIAKGAESALVKKLNPYSVDAEEIRKLDIENISKKQLQKAINQTKTKMETAAKEFDFIRAKDLRDELFELKNLLKSKK
ncbi:MAG TPA: excinuclease ABC subunit UvrB [Flavobacteriales bacterium]|nr:excinuclease ABC subunit UvrB [Flavobacteriales bacterium]HIK63117.1 excinuclease ABC subunit UvrB [Flavobacteriales bacterium]